MSVYHVSVAVGSRWSMASTGNLYEVQSVDGNWIELAKVELCEQTVNEIQSTPMVVELAWFLRPDVREVHGLELTNREETES